MLALLNATLFPFALCTVETTTSKTDPVLLLFSFNMPKAANETLQTTKWFASRWFLLRASVLHSLSPMIPIALMVLKRPLDVELYSTNWIIVDSDTPKNERD